MKITLMECQVECLRAVKRWNLGVEGVTPGTGPPTPTSLQILGAVPRDLIEIELFGRFSRQQVQRELAELELNGLMSHAVCPRVRYPSMYFTTMDGAHAEIDVDEPDGNGKTKVTLRRAPLSHIRRLEDEVLGYKLEPHGVEALADFEEALKTGKQVVKHHFFPEINTPLARFIDVTDMAYQQDLSGWTYSDGRPAYSGVGPLKNWGDVQEAYEQAKAFVLELSSAKVVEEALDECFRAIRANADAQHGGKATDHILSVAGKYITARERLRGYLRVRPKTPSEPETIVPAKIVDVELPREKESVLQLKERAEEWVRTHGHSFPGTRPLARDLQCPESSLDKAIKMSTYLKARKAEYAAKRKSFRSQSLGEFVLDNVAQTREVEPEATLEDLVREQQSDDAADNRRMRKGRPQDRT